MGDYSIGNAERLDARLLDLLLEGREPEVFVDRLAALAAVSFSSAELHVACGLTLLRRKKPRTISGSDPAATSLEHLQEKSHGGPSGLAVRTGKTVDAPDLAAEVRWPLFTDEARQQGIAAILAVPLQLEAGAQAALTLYSRRTLSPNGFEAFAVQAGKALRVVLHTAELEQAHSDMAAAMQSRTAIDVATGVLMAENRCNQHEAFQIMRRASNNRNLKLRDLARQITDAVSSGGEVTAHFDA